MPLTPNADMRIPAIVSDDRPDIRGSFGAVHCERSTIAAEQLRPGYTKGLLSAGVV